jgi:hypothetical protein
MERKFEILQYSRFSLKCLCPKVELLCWFVSSKISQEKNLMRCHHNAHYGFMEGPFIIRNLYENTLKIYKFQSSEYVVLFLELKLLNKKVVR